MSTIEQRKILLKTFFLLKKCHFMAFLRMVSTIKFHFRIDFNIFEPINNTFIPLIEYEMLPEKSVRSFNHIHPLFLQHPGFVLQHKHEATSCLRLHFCTTYGKTLWKSKTKKGAGKALFERFRTKL